MAGRIAWVEKDCLVISDKLSVGHSKVENETWNRIADAINSTHYAALEQACAESGNLIIEKWRKKYEDMKADRDNLHAQVLHYEGAREPCVLGSWK